MLKELFVPLIDVFSLFNIFRYITFRAAYAAVTALFLSFILGPPLIRYLKKVKIGQNVRDEVPETHLAKTGTPTMGGILINFSIIISVLLWQDLNTLFTWLGIVAVIGFGLIGFADDYFKVFKKNPQGIKAWQKFIAQVFVSLAIVLIIYFTGDENTTLLYIPFFKHPVLDLGVFYIPLAVLLLVYTSNSVNLTDGLDGLATGLMILVGIAFAVLSYLTGRADYAAYLAIPYIAESGELTVLSFAVVGAAVGFLWYNSHPAEIMMGDTGSLALGGVIGVISLLIKKEVLLFIIGGVFILEGLSVIIQVVSYKLRKKRVFKMAPLHHHFELSGWDESKVVIRFWILGGLFAILSLSTLKLQ